MDTARKSGARSCAPTSAPSAPSTERKARKALPKSPKITFPDHSARVHRYHGPSLSMRDGELFLLADEPKGGDV